jgi:uncharacterized membrane protein
MPSSLVNWLETAWRVFHLSTDRILWNSFLALIPLLLSFWLFRGSRDRSWFWWLVAAVFLAFLPNAPYILTDSVHVIDYIREGQAKSIVILVLFPQYTIFLFLGFQAYVLSLINLEAFLREYGLRKWILPAGIVIHILCSIGIYLGRFLRFNSWDLLARPGAVIGSIDDLSSKQPFIFTLFTFLIIWGLYELIKRIDRTLLPDLFSPDRKKNSES